MPSLDISRDSFQRPKNYTSVRWQQGRIPLESEMNEAADIAAEELRRALKDLICTSGTPDDGFRISNVAANEDGLTDLDVAQGTYYIGGTRYDALNATTFRAQPDWLQLPFDLDPQPAPPAAGEDERRDFVYLEGWEQVVSATEDAELFERALGGADTAGRKRRMARVCIVEAAADSCTQSLADLLGDRQIDPLTCGIVTGAGLTVGFDDTGVEENLCAPQTQEGYLGAENETFRVQLTAPDRFIYGRDNAAPLYRVQLEPVDPPEDAPVGTPGQTRITFLSRPRDVASQPLAGQAVELFRWNTRLPNGEKLAEPIGQLANIATDYDPADGTLLVDWELDSDWTDWFTGAGAGNENPLDEEEIARYFYLRVWTGGSGDALAPDHAIVAGAIPLPGTGLEITFAPALTAGTFGDPGEFWVIAARPDAPDVVTPWRLMDASAETPPPAPPAGPLRYIAPLATITWTSDASGNITAIAEDCRERFRKLCMVDSCCEISVGDGVRSFGDVNDIGEAVARLPLSGGRICLLRGTHAASIDLSGRHDILFSGCAGETFWIADTTIDVATVPAAVVLSGCEQITFQDFAMVAEDRDVARVGSRTGESEREGRARAITFRRMELTGRDAAVLWMNGCDELRVENCRVTQEELSESRTRQPEAGTDPAIFALGEDIHLEHDEITVDSAIVAESRPLGGVTIGGTSTDIVIRDNRIIGGKGNGITLGHIEWVVVGGGFTGIWTWGTGFTINQAGCLVPFFFPIPPDSDTREDLVPVSGGEILDLLIEGNLIAEMGLSGISVAHFFDLENTPDFISLARGRIVQNVITGCLRTDLDTPPLEIRYFSGVGGIALAACDLIEIDRNEIHANGIDVTAPNAGIFILYCAGAAIRDNLIYGNGASAQRGASLEPGRRGGVNIGWAVTFAQGNANDKLPRRSPPRLAALTMSGNFVDSTHGRALKLVALGPVRIHDNRLIGAGASAPELALLGFLLTLRPRVTGILGLLAALVSLAPVIRRDFAANNLALGELLIAALGGNAVSVFNLAFLEEITGGYDDDDAASDLAVGGETLFNDNQVGFRPHGSEAGSHVSAVLVASLDDVSMVANQLECDTGFDMVLSNCFALGATVRMADNRMQEQLARTLFSGYSHGLLLNTTATNQGTHCFAVTTLFAASGANLVNRDNLSLIDLFIGLDGGFCAALARYLASLGSADGNRGGGRILPERGSDLRGNAIGQTLARDNYIEVRDRQVEPEAVRSWGTYAFVSEPASLG